MGDAESAGRSPESLMEDLQDKLLLLRPADTQQVGAAALAVKMGLQPGQLLLLAGRVEHLHGTEAAMDQHRESGSQALPFQSSNVVKI